MVCSPYATSDPVLIFQYLSDQFPAVTQFLISAVKPKNGQAIYVLYLQFTEIGQ